MRVLCKHLIFNHLSMLENQCNNDYNPSFYKVFSTIQRSTTDTTKVTMWSMNLASNIIYTI